MAYPLVSIILNLIDAAGNPLTTGSATFTPTSAVSGPDGIQEIAPKPVTVQLNSSSFPVSVPLIATDTVATSWAWQVAFTGVDLDPFTFRAPAGPVSFTGATGTPGVVTWTATSGLTVLPPGTGVKVAGGSLPAGLAAGATYFVVSATAQTLSLSATAGGSPVAFTGTGSGTLTVVSYYLAGLTPVAPSTSFATTLANPMTTAGDMLYGGTAGAATRIAGNVTATRKFLRQAGTGSASAPPAWDTLQPGDVPAANGVTVLVPAPAGATATDTPNVTAAITSLASALAFGPATLQFRDGTYQVDSNSAVVRSLSNFSVRSSGATVIEQAPGRAGLPNNVTGDLLVIADCTDFTVAPGITFDGMRDTVAPLTALTAAATSGQPAVTVAAGQGSRYITGQKLYLFGGLGSSEQNQAEGFGVGTGTPLVIASITTGGGTGGGDLITFTANLASAYTQVSGTMVNDSTGSPYACTGAYLTCYQTGSGNTVAGRTLSGEDQQNGLHLISCKRFDVTGITSRNVWESPVKLGTGFASTSLTDGCSQGTITGSRMRHGYDQGVSLWLCDHVTVSGNTMEATGWAGASCSLANDCIVTANQVVSPVYAAPGNTASGHGVAVEGGLRNKVTGNVITSPAGVGIYPRVAPPVFSIGASTSPALTAFLEAGTAAGTSVAVSSTARLVAGGLYCILDGSRTEAVTVAAAGIVDGTHVQFTERMKFSHASGSFVTLRVAADNLIEGNTVTGAGQAGIAPFGSARNTIRGNTVTGYGAVTAGSPGIDLRSTATLLPATLGGDGSLIEGNTVTGGAGVPLYMTSVSHVRARGNRLGSPLTGATYPGLIAQGATDFEVSGNWVSETVDGPGMEIQGNCARGVVTGNTVRRCHSQAMLIQSCDSMVITGNNCSSSGEGLYLLGLTRCQVSQNTCNGNANHGIYLGDHTSTFSIGNVISGNTCRDDGSGVSVTTGAAQAQANGITEAGSSNGNLFSGNVVDSNATSQLTLVGAGSVQTRNIISGTVQGS